jgi:hypothetical protein
MLNQISIKGTRANCAVLTETLKEEGPTLIRGNCKTKESYFSLGDWWQPRPAIRIEELTPITGNVSIWMSFDLP